MYLKIVNEVDFHKLQSALNPLYSWATAWQLPISIDKCYVLNIGAENFRCNLEINNQALPNVLSACDLGITITSNLSATMHINGAHIHISPIIPLYLRHITYVFYRAMHFSAKRGIAIACRLSVRLSVRPSVRPSVRL